MAAKAEHAGERNYALIDCGPASYMYAAQGGRRTWRASAKRVLASVLFRSIGITCLVIALFGGGLCVILDLPDDPWNSVVDGVMLVVLLFFIAELILRLIVEVKEYPLSSLFWLDVLGTASMVFEISFLLGTAGKINSPDAGADTVMVRAARAARVGARVGRLSMPLRIPTIVYAGRRGKLSSPDSGLSARILGARVTLVLSSKVALLVSAIVLGTLVFTIGEYPEGDRSLVWTSGKLEADYARAYHMVSNRTLAAGSRGAISTTLFEGTVEDVATFYADMPYYPYRLVGFDDEVMLHGRTALIPGVSRARGPEPKRKQNVLRQFVPRCLVSRPGCEGGERASVYFDCTEAGRYDAAIDAGVVLFIIMCVGLSVWDISVSINRMVVGPLEKMLQTAHTMAAVLNQAIKHKGSKGQGDETERESDQDGDDEPEEDEAELLERVFKKMAALTHLFVEQNVIDDARMRDLDAESKGVIVEMMQYARREVRKSTAKGNIFLRGPSALMDLPVRPEEIQSWGLNLLGMRPPDQQKVVEYVMFDSPVGLSSGRHMLDQQCWRVFAEAVRHGYYDNPYHSFAHACDVVSSCNRLLSQVQCDEWLSDVEIVALLVSALCHDIGHPGKTNPFLVETGNELALRYNDKSPLENMHCARLFEICSDAKTDVFSKFDRAGYKQARAVCIDGILFTDNARHFDLVKDIKKVRETFSDLCDAQLANRDTLSPQYVQEVIGKNTMLWIKVILHTADVSNPLKTFEMNKLWAMRVVDEFFAQGDEEKRLGIPVGMLNDRDKVSRSGAEHGFINFLLSPLVISVVQVFPTLYPQAVQMSSNMASWHQHWMHDSQPSEEDIKKREADIEKVRDMVNQLDPNRKPRLSPSDTAVA